MGAVISRIAGAFVFAGEKVGLATERMEKARRDKMWRDNPQLRKLVPKSRCPHCRARLEPKCLDSSSDSSGDEMKANKAAVPQNPPALKPIRSDAGRKEEAFQEPLKKPTVVTFVGEVENPKEFEKTGVNRLVGFEGVVGTDELNFNGGLQKVDEGEVNQQAAYEGTGGTDELNFNGGLQVQKVEGEVTVCSSKVEVLDQSTTQTTPTTATVPPMFLDQSTKPTTTTTLTPF